MASGVRPCPTSVSHARLRLPTPRRLADRAAAVADVVGLLVPLASASLPRPADRPCACVPSLKLPMALLDRAVRDDAVDVWCIVDVSREEPSKLATGAEAGRNRLAMLLVALRRRGRRGLVRSAHRITRQHQFATARTQGQGQAGRECGHRTLVRTACLARLSSAWAWQN